MSDALRAEVYRLADESLRDELLAQSRLRLHELISTNAEARSFYLEFLIDGVHLSQMSYGLASSEILTEGKIDLQVLRSLQANQGHLIAPAPALPSWMSRLRTRLDYTEYPLAFSLFLGLLTVASLLLSALQFPLRSTPHPSSPSPRVAQPIVAGIVQEQDCQWVGGAVFSSELRLGQQLHLLAGLVEMKFRDGTHLILEAPVQFTLDSPAGGYLTAGKLYARMPLQKSGFTIRTPLGEIVDLGTEFGVEVLNPQEIKTTVFSGRVLVRPESQPSQGFELAAGESWQFSQRGALQKLVVSEIHDQEASYIRQLPQASPRVSYPATLLGYWTFDAAAAPAQDQRGRHPGKMSASHRTAGLVGSGAAGFGTHAAAIEVPLRSENLALAQGLTIEALFASAWRGDADEPNHLVRLFFEQGPLRAVTLTLQHNPQAEAGGAVIAFRVENERGLHALDLPLDGQEGRPAFSEITDGGTHHAAATFDPQSGELGIYLDGVSRIQRVVAPTRGAQLHDWTALSDPTGQPSFRGVLDEIAISGVPLSKYEIARHWKNARAGRGYFEQPE